MFRKWINAHRDYFQKKKYKITAKSDRQTDPFLIEKRSWSCPGVFATFGKPSLWHVLFPADIHDWSKPGLFGRVYVLRFSTYVIISRLKESLKHDYKTWTI